MVNTRTELGALPRFSCPGVTLGKLFSLFELTVLLGKMSISGWLSKTSRDLENKHGYRRRGMVERDSYGVWNGHARTAIFIYLFVLFCLRLYLKWITNKDLLGSTGSSAHVMCQPGWEGSFEGE